ncbi:hypothetical protein BAUCODRAFT_554972 [Baudoinia panamericana UAMH 10762]|uniref:Uncharacterized protein n=1 Tax=Baudoinia panamericana (strain UAMH 10762) TaxID=717646 RepID=M2MT05_BAUPA|nr:uncharacterized protein BAUCODRAFT_554972 [Baudoinia panamericana UAMH 10762]EMC94653.1 hypothetical protein BAUCODRAFT_554972 [Baudoinia panamericana UAMH 10762]
MVFLRVASRFREATSLQHQPTQPRTWTVSVEDRGSFCLCHPSLRYLAGHVVHVAYLHAFQTHTVTLRASPALRHDSTLASRSLRRRVQGGWSALDHRVCVRWVANCSIHSSHHCDLEQLGLSAVC